MKISILHFDSWEVQKEDGEWKREKLSKKKEKRKRQTLFRTEGQECSDCKAIKCIAPFK